MVWKPKEKDLTPEEAIELAKKELAPYWHGCSPQFAAVKKGAGDEASISLHPLNREFSQKNWIFYFIDPTTHNGESCLYFAREFSKRYNQALGALAILRPRFEFYKEAGPMEVFLRILQIPFSVVVDHEGMLAAAFGVRAWPRIFLWAGGKTVLERDGPGWVVDTEVEIQRFLRQTDPGLPLFPPFRPALPLARDTVAIDFGRGRGAGFPAPGFSKPVGAFGSAKFSGKRPEEFPPPDKFFITGQWMQDVDRIATSDPTAEISFRSPASGFSVVAQSLTKIVDPARISIEVMGRPVFDVFGGADFSFDDEGRSVLKLEGPRLYHALKNLPARERDVTLRFPFADKAAVALYGLRFGELVAG